MQVSALSLCTTVSRWLSPQWEGYLEGQVSKVCTQSPTHLRSTQQMFDLGFLFDLT